MIFEDLDLSIDVLDAVYDMHFEECTSIQEKCIPQILDGHDVLGIAQTGTGKTAAYLLPIITLLQEEPHPKDSVNCLIMAPTRELAQQIDKALQGFAYYTDIKGVAVYGGNDGIRFEQEKKSLKTGADIIIATPGRLLTHMDLGNVDLSKTTYLILDEADRMLDMGFSEDIFKIVKFLPKKRQTILFSATMPAKIEDLAKTIMHHPVLEKIAVAKPAENINQHVYFCREQDKLAVVNHIFSFYAPKSVIIFAAKKSGVKELNMMLKRKGFNVDAMHSDLEQSQRDDVMLRFKAGKIDVLVATDIVARGIDIDNISMVINYDTPHDPEDYVHRIGRTARAGRKGESFTLVNEKDVRALQNIERLLEKKIEHCALPDGLKEPDFTSVESNASYKKKKGRFHGNKKGKYFKSRKPQHNNPKNK